ncbi:MAG: AMP-binding protein, partial [Spirochaetales bacterium]
MYVLENLSLVEMIEKSGKQYAARPALSMVGGERFTYAEIDAASLRLAGKLHALGVGQGDKVALLAENSPHWGIAYFAILRAGGIVVPILTDFTAEQIKNIVAHSGAKAILCSNKLHQKIQAAEIAAMQLDILGGSPRNKPANQEKTSGATKERALPFEPFHPKSDDVAMIVYTSGTTGLSKGVMLSHRN